ncbi:MAG: HAD family hydrolase [Candidatus Staskawiczbacteria bacterium]|nr:HAD family hydrolase [Candidatus Staskawiczbacteria bacterium]
MIKTIIFDLDGTLYKEKEFAESGFRAVSEYIFKKHKIGKSKVFNILKKDFEAGLRNKNFNVLLKKIDLARKENVLNLAEIYRNHYPSKISLYPDARKILKKTRNDFKLALLTNGRIISQKNKISALGIKNYFKAILISTDFGDNDWKKSASSFNILLKKTKSRPKEMIYVGDNPKRDFMGAKKIGILTVRIKRKGDDCYNVPENKKNKADFIAANLLGLDKIIKKYQNEK